MSDVAISLQLKCAYKGTEFTRSYKMSGVSASTLNDVESAVEAINTSLAGGTAGGLSTTFISDDYDGSIGTLEKITEATIVHQTTTAIEF